MIAKQARAFASESAAEAFARSIIQRPDYSVMKESGLFLPSTYDVEFAGHAPRRLASGERLDAGADNGRRDAKPSRMDFRKALAHVRQEIEGGRNGTRAVLWVNLSPWAARRERCRGVRGHVPTKKRGAGLPGGVTCTSSYGQRPPCYSP